MIHDRYRRGAGLLGLFIGACSGGDDAQPLLDRGSCDVLIECASNLAPEARDEYEQAYGPNGTCWANGPNSWAACRDFCSSTLEALNLVAMVTGEACGTCSTDADCSSYGAGATCAGGFCSGGSGSNADGETGDGDNETTDATTTDTDGEGCTSVPAVCQDFLACIAAVLPNSDVSEFEDGGACWCGTSEKADECVAICIDQLEAAATSYPNEPACVDQVDPCAGWDNKAEGCPCVESVDCAGNLLCDDWTDECVVPDFGSCEAGDPYCPSNGCPNGLLRYDKNFDGVADFAMCKYGCDEEFGPGECASIDLEYFTDSECVSSSYFGFFNGLACVNTCDLGSCPDGSVCINDFCWYDLP